jgi:5-methylcytosine-specific restriction endonuclease McrA
MNKRQFSLMRCWPEATARLEIRWNKLCQKEGFCLFCAYPKNVFSSDDDSAVNHVCSFHTKMIAGSENQMKEIFYRENDY